LADAEQEQGGCLKKAKRPDYMVTLRKKNRDIEIVYLETGKPNSNLTKQLKDHFKLNRLARAAIDFSKQAKNQRFIKYTPSIFTINVAGDRLEIRHMYKHLGIYKNCLLQQTRIPLCISDMKPDEVYSLIHALLTFRTAIACDILNKEYKESSAMSVDDASSVVDTSSIMSFEFEFEFVNETSTSIVKKGGKRKRK